MPMVEDLSAFFNNKEHATSAVYKSVTIDGIFENQFVESNGIETSTPTYLCAAADVSGVLHDDTILINSITYTIVGDQPDGTGLILLILREP